MRLTQTFNYVIEVSEYHTYEELRHHYRLNSYSLQIHMEYHTYEELRPVEKAKKYKEIEHMEYHTYEELRRAGAGFSGSTGAEYHTYEELDG